MVLLNAKLISGDEATQVRDNCLREISLQLKQASICVTKLLLTLDGRDVHRDVHSDLHNIGVMSKIESLIKSLDIELSVYFAVPITPNELVERTKAIYTEFGQFYDDIRWKDDTLVAETSAVLAHASARWVADADSIIQDPKRALISNFNENWSFTGENERIAAEFQARIPVFCGFRVLAEGRPPDIVITLRSDPRHTESPGNPPLDKLKTEVERLLEWELRKIGFTMEYEVNVFDNPPPRMIYCPIKLVTPNN